MNHLIEQNLDKIRSLCKRYKVKTLSVFGSVLTDRFNDKSDIDILVDFEPYDPYSFEFDYLSNFCDFCKIRSEMTPDSIFGLTP